MKCNVNGTYLNISLECLLFSVGWFTQYFLQIQNSKNIILEENLNFVCDVIYTAANEFIMFILLFGFVYFSH